MLLFRGITVSVVEWSLQASLSLSSWNYIPSQKKAGPNRNASVDKEVKVQRTIKSRSGTLATGLAPDQQRANRNTMTKYTYRTLTVSDIYYRPPAPPQPTTTSGKVCSSLCWRWWLNAEGCVPIPYHHQPQGRYVCWRWLNAEGCIPIPYFCIFR